MRLLHVRLRRRGLAAGIALTSTLALVGCTATGPSASPTDSATTASSVSGSPSSSPTESTTPAPTAPAPTTPTQWPQFTDKDTQVTFRLPSQPSGFTFLAFPNSDYRQRGATYRAIYPLDAQSTSVDLTVTVYQVTGTQCVDGRTELESLQHGWIKDGFKSVTLTGVHSRQSGGLSLTTGLILRDDPVLGRWSETYVMHVDKGDVGILVGAGAQTTEAGLTPDQLSAIQSLVSDTVEQVGYPASVQDSSCGSSAKGSSGSGTAT